MEARTCGNDEAVIATSAGFDDSPVVSSIIGFSADLWCYRHLCLRRVMEDALLGRFSACAVGIVGGSLVRNSSISRAGEPRLGVHRGDDRGSSLDSLWGMELRTSRGGACYLNV